jgi:hypothetical protein
MSRLAIVAMLAGLVAAGTARATPPSDGSIDAFLTASRLERNLGLMRQSMDQLMKQSVAEAVGARALTDRQKRSIDAVLERFSRTMNEDLGWEKMRPLYAQIYKETFTAEEIDGVVAFYKSPAGVALLEKQPLVLQKASTMVRERMAGWNEKLRAELQRALQDKDPR